MKDYSRIAETLYKRGVLTEDQFKSRDWSAVPPEDENFVKKILRIKEGNAVVHAPMGDIAANVAASRQHEEYAGKAQPIDPKTGRPKPVNPQRHFGQMTVGGYRIQVLVDEEGRVRIAALGDPWTRYKLVKAKDGMILVLWPEFNVSGDPYKDI